MTTVKAHFKNKQQLRDQKYEQMKIKNASTSETEITKLVVQRKKKYIHGARATQPRLYFLIALCLYSHEKV